MASMSIEKPAQKKQKMTYMCSGIAEAILNEDGEIFLMDSDRHHWPGDTKQEWEKQWYEGKGKHPYPFQVYTVKEKLVLLGESYTPEQQAEYILAHALSKGWAPKIFFDSDKEAADAVEHMEYAVTPEKLRDFHAMLYWHTQQVKDHHWLEMVFGACKGPDGKPAGTYDMNVIETTRAAEVFEESGAITEATFLGYTDPRTTKDGEVVTAMFKSTMEKESMNRLWESTVKLRRPTGYEWQCPHSWYKKIPGIDQMLAATEKEMRETSNGGWYPFEVHPRMDTKNKTTIQKMKSI